MAVQFVDAVEPMPEEAKAKQAKKMPTADKWRCTKCGKKGHKRSACGGRKTEQVEPLPLISLTQLRDMLTTRVEEEITDAEADLRALRRLQARLAGPAS